jgi:hypothetical protein
MIMKAIMTSTGPTVALLLFLLLPHSGQCFYNASTGRWLSRDPIGERGGIQLYALLANSPISIVDAYGLCCKCLRVHVTYDPGGDTMSGFKWYDDPLFPGTPRFGNQIHVVWDVAGDTNQCRFYQDESRLTMDITRPDGTTTHIQGANNLSSEDNYDDLGFPPSAGDGYYLLELNWDVTFRCFGSNPSDPPKERHDGLWKILARTHWPPL